MVAARDARRKLGETLCPVNRAGTEWLAEEEPIHQVDEERAKYIRTPLYYVKKCRAGQIRPRVSVLGCYFDSAQSMWLCVSV